MSRKNLYLFLCVIGFAIPYSQFVPWLMHNGLDARLFVAQMFANRISSFFVADVLVSAAVLVAFMGQESRRLKDCSSRICDCRVVPCRRVVCFAAFPLPPRASARIR